MPPPTATSLLVGALNHSDPRMRQLAATTLQHRRARSALGSLVEQYKTEKDSAIAVALAVAIVASGPTSIGSLERSHQDNDALKLWQCDFGTNRPPSDHRPRLRLDAKLAAPSRCDTCSRTPTLHRSFGRNCSSSHQRAINANSGQWLSSLLPRGGWTVSAYPSAEPVRAVLRG